MPNIIFNLYTVILHWHYHVYIYQTRTQAHGNGFCSSVGRVLVQRSMVAGVWHLGIYRFCLLYLTGKQLSTKKILNFFRAPKGIQSIRRSWLPPEIEIFALPNTCGLFIAFQSIYSPMPSQVSVPDTVCTSVSISHCFYTV